MAEHTAYQIALTRELSVPQRAVAGEIISPEKTFKCEITVNDSLVAKYEMRDLFLSLLPLNPLTVPQYKIVITADFLRRLQKKDADAFFKLYHELGHIHHQDLIRAAKAEGTKETALSGEPTAEDLTADAFAKDYMGLKNSVHALKAIEKEREELCRGAACGDRAELNRAAVEEIRKRIEAIRPK